MYLGEQKVAEVSEPLATHAEGQDGVPGSFGPDLATKPLAREKM